LPVMQSHRIFTIEKSIWHRYFQRKASFIYHGKVRHSFSHLIFKTQMHFWDSENALFEKFEGQKTALRSEKTSAKADSNFDKLVFTGGNVEKYPHVFAISGKKLLLSGFLLFAIILPVQNRITEKTKMTAIAMRQASASQGLVIHRPPAEVRLLYRNEQSENELWNTLENLRENVRDSKGQFISLDLTEPPDLTEPQESLLDALYATLKNARWERSLQFSLPTILQHNPHVAAPFINRAILWQRLCDLLILDDEPHRETVLVLENIDHASIAAQQEIVRLLRFHETYSIHRTFVFTLNYPSLEQIIPELQDILAL
jgi:hypothetical protein